LFHSAAGPPFLVTTTRSWATSSITWLKLAQQGAHASRRRCGPRIRPSLRPDDHRLVDASSKQHLWFAAATAIVHGPIAD
jgi:hypothetical protein